MYRIEPRLEWTEEQKVGYKKIDTTFWKGGSYFGKNFP